MLSKLSVGKYRDLATAILVFLLLDIGVLFFNVYSSYELENDAARINLAGFQRALTQNMGKSILSVQQEKRDNLSMDNSLKALRESAVSFDDGLNTLKKTKLDSALFGLFGLDTQAVSQAATTVEPLWAAYKTSLQPLLNPNFSPDANDIASAAAESKASNARLMVASQAVVAQVQQAAQIKAQSMRWIQITAIVLALLNFIYILFKFLSRLGASDQQIEAAQKETADILNTVDEGLMLIDAQGKAGTQMSRAVHTLFGRTVSPGEDFRDLVTRLVDTERADEIKIYIDLLFDPKVKPALLVQLDPLKEIEVFADTPDKRRFLSFNLRQLRSDDAITGLLVTISDVTKRMLLERELASTQSEARTDVEDLLRVFEHEPETMHEFLSVTKQKLNHLNEAMRTVGKTDSAYKALVKSTALTIHGVKGESAALSLTGVSRQSHIMENAMSDLLRRQNISGEDLIPVVYELSRVQEQVARIENLFKRITAGNVFAQPKAMFAPSQIMLDNQPSAMPEQAQSKPSLQAADHNALAPDAAQTKATPPTPTATPAELIATQSGPPKLTNIVAAPEPTAPAPTPIKRAAEHLLNEENTGLSPITMMFAGNLPPLEEMANNLKKLSTEVAKSLGKTVQLTYTIAPVKPSGLMLRVLREVLPQLVRNSVVHGIESSFDRLGAGKPEQGQLHLNISNFSDNITQVSLKDDGRGITVEAVKARLVEMGFKTEGLSNSHILQHIFEMQFSTATQITEHAGRGVGLALVKQSLEKAGAKLKVNTRPGQSTEFVLHFGRDT